jgi:hypothetical protein
MQAEGYFLYIPPDPVKSRFVMLDEITNTFHDVDLETPLLGNPASWKATGVSPTVLGQHLAIVFPNPLDADHKAQLGEQGYNPEFQVGRLVSVDRRESKKVYGKIIAKVNVKPLPEGFMSWQGLKEKKGAILPNEMKNGLCGRLWGRPNAGTDLVTSRDILDNMPRKWHIDPVALNYELDRIFAAGERIRRGDVIWVLKGN